MQQIIERKDKDDRLEQTIIDNNCIFETKKYRGIDYRRVESPNGMIFFDFYTPTSGEHIMTPCFTNINNDPVRTKEIEDSLLKEIGNY